MLIYVHPSAAGQMGRARQHFSLIVQGISKSPAVRKLLIIIHKFRPLNQLITRKNVGFFLFLS